MGFFEKLGQGFETLRFLFEHDTTPEMADRARQIYLLHKASVDFWLGVGVITEEQASEAGRNLQNTILFEQIMEDAESLDRRRQASSKNAISELSYSPATMAAFSRFQLQRLEERWKIKLISPED